MVVLHSSGYQTLPCYWLFGPDITNDRFWFAVLAVNFGFVCSERRTGQDFPFSPILFMIFLDRISRYTPRHWRAQIGCFGLAPLLFAQDGTVGLFKPQFPNLTGAIQSRVRSNLDDYLGRWKGHTNESLESPNFCLASRIVWHVLHLPSLALTTWKTAPSWCQEAWHDRGHSWPFWCGAHNHIVVYSI